MEDPANSAKLDGIAFCEMPNSPIVNFGQNGVTGTRRFRVEWAKAHEFVEAIFMRKYGEAERMLSHPNKTWINDNPTKGREYTACAISAEIIPGNDGQTIRAPLSFGVSVGLPEPTHTYAIVEVMYATPSLQDFQLTMGMSMKGVPSDNFTFTSDGESVPKVNAGQSVVNMPEGMVDIQFWYYDYHVRAQGGDKYTGESIRKNIGSINRTEYTFPKMMDPKSEESATIKWPIGTLLFSGADISREIFYNIMVTRYTLNFKYRPNNWNHEFRAKKPTGWEAVHLDAGKKKHTEIDFKTIIPVTTGEIIV